MDQGDAYHIDLHVHTRRYSSCAEFVDPYQIGHYCHRAGIDAVVLAEHNTLWPADELDELQGHLGDVTLFNGIEVTTREDCHLVIIGLESGDGLSKGIACRDAIARAREQGGLVILAHPYRGNLPPLQTIALVDAIETGSTSLHERESKLAVFLAATLDKPAVASSDAHALSMIGWAYTSLPDRPQDTEQLCRMIRAGEGRPVRPHPFLG